MFAASRVARVLVRSSAAHAPHARPAFGGTCRRALSSSSRPRDDDEGPVAATEADTHALVDMDAFLAPLRNHERTGVPRGAGSSASEPEQRFDLGRMRRLLATLGDPHVGYPVIHVAGTKGKGSVVSFLAAILREAGVNTGTYKSPHVRSVRERIVCGPFDAARRDAADGRLFAGGGLDAATAEATRAFVKSESASAKSASGTDGGSLSYFEALTAFAFSAFARANVECAVVEVGVGGAVDATNVVPAAHTAASVLTALGDDHLEALGGSRGAVAAAKAGITRARRPVFVGVQPCIELEVLLLSNVYAAGGRLIDESDVATRAVSRGTRVGSEGDEGDVAQIVDFEIASRPRDDDGTKPLEWRALRGVRMRALGPHQRENARLAVSVIEFLRRGGGARRDGGDADPRLPWSRVADDDVRRGLETAHSPGCFEIIRRPPDDTECGSPVWIVADGAHTAGSAEAAFATLRETTLLETTKTRLENESGACLAVVVAMASDKNHVDVMREVLHADPAFVFCAETLVSGGTARAAPATALRDAFRAAKIAAKNASGGEKHKENDAETCPRVVVIPELERAMAEAVDAVRDRGGGVVCVLGSLNVVARAEAWANGTGGE
jgi:folylpolyglutamate synthase